MGLRGPSPRDSETLKLHGRFKESLHADRDKIAPAIGEPVRPAHLKGEALKHWKENLPRLMANRTIGESDTAAFVLLCETWALLRKALAAVNKYPTDKDSRIAFGEYSRQWIALAAKLGLTSLDRSRILVDKPAESSPRISSFARDRNAI